MHTMGQASSYALNYSRPSEKKVQNGISHIRDFLGKHLCRKIGRRLEGSDSDTGVVRVKEGKKARSQEGKKEGQKGEREGRKEGRRT